MSEGEPRNPSLTPGTRLGPYEVGARIGVGGMGQVYRATDTKLRRQVAIKVLPPGFAEDPERLSRFEREAQLLAQLHHPNIASIFGLEESGGVRALVLELVEGPTLAERLEAGPLSLADSLAIAVQIAQALEQAHERGIVHRDLKPQNVKAPPEDDVKVLDFGLAKALEAGAAGSSSPDRSMSPTLLESPTPGSGQSTQVGAILGTAAYMAPEQAKGMAIDKRADIWAFGVVLYEMLAGRSLFGGDSVADTLAGVLKTEIELTTLPPGTPPPVRRLLRRCLERNPHNRLHDIADARIVLEEVAADPDRAEEGAAAVAAGPPSTLSRLLPWAIAAAAMAATAIVVLQGGSGASTTPPPLTTFGLPLPAGHTLTRMDSPILDVSADGQIVVTVANDGSRQGIFLRRFDRLEFVPVPGTSGGAQPILSPDGSSIAFFASGQLLKVPVDGGEPVALASAQAQRGACWGPAGSIIFSPLYNAGLWSVPSTGGEPVEVTHLDEARQERTHRWPHLLPDGNTLIFTVGLMEATSDYDVARIDAQRLDTGERVTLLEDARMARYGNGYLVFQRRQSLLAVRFDPVALRTTGQPFVIREGVGGDTGSGSGYFAVSAAGAVALAPENALPGNGAIVWRDRDGVERELPLERASFTAVRMSPSADRVAIGVGTGGLAADEDVYLFDLAAEQLQRLTFEQYRGFPIWSPDGQQVLYTVGASGQQGLATRAADGSGGESMVPVNTDRTVFLLADAWLADGRMIVTDVQRSLDVYLVDATTRELVPLAANPNVAESAASVSPDGRFFAYASNESGGDTVFVESLPQGAGKWVISGQGGSCPVWSPDGRQIYFARGSTMMAVDVNADSVFRSGTPRELFSGPYDLCAAARRRYDVTPDGGLVLITHAPVSSAGAGLVLLQGWQTLEPSADGGR